MVLAAGAGRRIGGNTAKVFLPLAGRPLLLHTLDRVFSARSIEQVVLVVAVNEVARCQTCHADTKNFDVNGVQTEVKAMLEELHTLFVDNKLLNPETDLWGIWDEAAGKFVNPSADAPLVVPVAVAQAMWNYKFVTYDQSNGAHNAAYAKALLEAALETMRAYTP